MGLEFKLAGSLGFLLALVAWGESRAQEAELPAPVAPSPSITRLVGESGETTGALVEQLRKHPAEPSTAAGRVGLYLIGADGGEATLIASEPDPWLNQCGSPIWSTDGRRILFDATPGIADFSLSRIKGLQLDEGHLSVKDLRPGNCPSPSPQGDRVIFLLNPGAVPGAESCVWLMNADGTGRRKLGGYGRPRWSPDGHQFLIIDFGNPCGVTVIDDRPGNPSGELRIPGERVYQAPSWAGESTIVAVIGEEVPDAIALIDVSDPGRGRVKETLWTRNRKLDVIPSSPVYSPVTRRCAFIGKQEGKGRALYTFLQGQTEPPRRLEPGDFDNLIQDPAYSPDGRYLVFSSNRPDRRPAKNAAPGRRPSVDAPALSGITIDGDLKDWPPAMERHAIRNIQTFPRTNGTGGVEHAFLSTSPDLSAAFSVGYDPKEQVIYVAVIVRDDSLIVGHTSSWETDAVEIYVDGLHSDRSMPHPGLQVYDDLDAGVCPALEYIGLPGEGPVFGITKSAGVKRSGKDNPVLQFGDIAKTKTRMAFRRAGDVTTYEWAVQAFDHYPDKPTPLVPGMKIGLDVVVIDRDKPAKNPSGWDDPEEDLSVWVSWGPAIHYGEFKGFDASKLGEIVLGRTPRP
jgi:hypothetical protein